MNETENLLNERAKTHGSFAVHAQTTQNLKRIIRLQTKYLAGGSGTDCKSFYLNDEQREALDMILHKIGRIMAGDHDFKDHWDDIAGYATLGSKACKPKT